MKRKSNKSSYLRTSKWLTFLLDRWLKQWIDYQTCWLTNISTNFLTLPPFIHDPLPCSLLPRWGASGALGCWSSVGTSPWRQPASYSRRWLCSSSAPPPSPRPPVALHPTQTCHPACSCRRLSSPSSGQWSGVGVVEMERRREERNELLCSA